MCHRIADRDLCHRIADRGFCSIGCTFRVRVCHFYFKLGHCKYDSSTCRFAHTRSSAPHGNSAEARSAEVARRRPRGGGHAPERHEEESSARKRSWSEVIAGEEENLRAQREVVRELRRQRRFGVDCPGSEARSRRGESSELRTATPIPPWRRAKEHARSFSPASRRRQDERSGSNAPRAKRAPRPSVAPRVDSADLEQDEKDAVSRALSRILRHRAQHAGLAIRSNGFCVLERVLNLREMKELRVNKKVVEEVTRSNDKQRFELRFMDGQQMIRAVQGHSLEAVEDDALGRRLRLDCGALPEKCVHGTYARHWESIVARGLIAGGLGAACQRNHIHFAPYTLTEGRVISGMRSGCDIAVYVNLRKALLQAFLSLWRRMRSS